MRRGMLLPLLLLVLGCATTRPGQEAPPRNFAVVVPERIYRGGQPGPGELEYLRSIGVKSILKLNDRGFAVDQQEAARAAALGLQLRSFAFSAVSIGTPPTCTSVREALAFLRDERNWPVFVHCTAGKDRTGYIIGMYEKEMLGKPAAEVLAELHRHGHRGLRSAVMGQIDAELARAAPACAE